MDTRHAPSSSSQAPPASRRGRFSLSPGWWRLTAVGYLISLLLVGILVLLRQVLETIHFVWTPFCFVSVVIGFVWGLGPALFAMALGIVAVDLLVDPLFGTHDTKVWGNPAGFIPFVLAQLAIAVVAAQNARKQRRLVATQQKTQKYAEELAMTNQRLHEVNQQLEQANQLKDSFLVRAAHELRTPLTSIQGYTQFALRRLKKAGTAAPERQSLQPYIEKIDAQAQDLRALVEQLFELSSLRTGAFPLHLDTCDLVDLCRSVLGDIHIISDHPLECKPSAGPLLLHADRRLIAQVLVNLVRNAITYAPDHSPIRISVEQENQHAFLQVHNEGPAIPQEVQQHLFEPFYRTPAAEATAKGWGLGLAISKEIVERHGGHIGVQSVAGQGSPFLSDFLSRTQRLPKRKMQQCLHLTSPCRDRSLISHGVQGRVKGGTAIIPRFSRDAKDRLTPVLVLVFAPGSPASA